MSLLHQLSARAKHNAYQQQPMGLAMQGLAACHTCNVCLRGQAQMNAVTQPREMYNAAACLECSISCRGQAQVAGAEGPQAPTADAPFEKLGLAPLQTPAGSTGPLQLSSHLMPSCHELCTTPPLHLCILTFLCNMSVQHDPQVVSWQVHIHAAMCHDLVQCRWPAVILPASEVCTAEPHLASRICSNSASPTCTHQGCW